ncbi:MAG: hypothetical protein K2Q10_06695, partial [Rhodospirillales bacterium]|nr:hypothetical protein [Rhodospirillales bacterium]
RAIALADIAARARIPLAEVHEHFPAKQDILEAFTRILDDRVLGIEIEEQATPRDRLFDVMMRRFEGMQPYRKAVGAILRESGGDPYAALCGLKRFMASMALSLEAAGISTTGLSGLAKVEAVAAIHLYTLRAWLNDDTADLSRTMAALDKSLRRAEWLAGMLWRRPGVTSANIHPPQVQPSP